MNIVVADAVLTKKNQLGTYSPPGGSIEGANAWENVVVYRPFLFGVIPTTAGRIDHSIVLSSEPLSGRVREINENGSAGFNYLRFVNFELSRQDKNTEDCFKASVIGHEMCHYRQEVRDGSPSLINDISKLNIKDLNPELFQMRFLGELEAYITGMLSINGTKYSPKADLMHIPSGGLYKLNTTQLTNEDMLDPLFYVAMVLSGIPLQDVITLIHEIQTNHDEGLDRFLVTREMALTNLDQIPVNPRDFFNRNRRHYLDARQGAGKELQKVSHKCLSHIHELVRSGKLDRQTLLSHNNGHISRFLKERNGRRN